ncbi:MAG: hypothetical protein GEV06_09375 [Luteitalea sp.]|nr:hypothetical protein [Luteitalea sp.]
MTTPTAQIFGDTPPPERNSRAKRAGPPVPPDPAETANIIDGQDRSFARIEDAHYVLSVPNLGIVLDIEHVRVERHQMHGELTVLCELPGARTFNNVLITGDYNLSSTAARSSLVRYLAPPNNARGVSDIDWDSLLLELSCRAIDAERAGSPAVLLRDVQPRGAEEWHHVFGFALPRRHPAMIFGDGDTLKTYTAGAIAVELARRDVRVGIVDWEMTEEEHQARVARLDAAQLDRIAYLSCARPLVHERDRVARMIRDHRLNYLLCDSVGFGCHEKLEAAESPMVYFRAVRSLGLGSLHIAHVTKSDTSDDQKPAGASKPFGSAYWFNSVRALWFAKRADDGLDRSVIDVGFYPRKYNLGGIAEDVRFALPVRRAGHDGLADRRC